MPLQRGSYGGFDCACKRDAALAETRHHATAVHAGHVRVADAVYCVQAKGPCPRSVRRRRTGHRVYLVHAPSGICLAALRARLLSHCLHATYLEYNWNGAALDAVLEVKQLI